MLHVSHDLKGAAATTDPRDTDTTDTPADELPETALDAVTGGGDVAFITGPASPGYGVALISPPSPR